MATIKSHLKIRGSWEMQACNIRFCCYIWLFLPLPTSESNCSRASQSKQKFSIVSRNGRTNGDRCRNATLLIFSLRFFFFFALSRGQKSDRGATTAARVNKKPHDLSQFFIRMRLLHTRDLQGGAATRKTIVYICAWKCFFPWKEIKGCYLFLWHTFPWTLYWVRIQTPLVASLIIQVTQYRQWFLSSKAIASRRLLV